MLYLLVIDRYPWREYLRRWGGSLKWRSRLISYEDVGDPAVLGDGTYIFGDIERLAPPELAAACRVWDLLSVRGNRVRLLNSPHTVLRRRDLLRTLYENGTNRFNVYGIEEARDAIRYPVFIRSARQHQGSYTPLLYNASAILIAIERLVGRGHDAADLLIVEFLDISSQGMFHKYSVMKLDKAIFAQHAFFSDNWIVKSSKNWSPENVRLDNAFLAENPHCDRLEPIFALANIDYGRADYSLLNGEIQIWEINTNPTLLMRKSFYGPDRMPGKAAFSHRFNAELKALDQHAQSPRLLDRIKNRLSLRR